jgi:DNA-binding protein YbaB
MLGDQERVEAIQQGLRVTRGLVAELMAIDPKVAADDGHHAVEVVFDRDGFLSDLVIAPTALADHTHIELEDLITDVLRDGNAQLNEAIMAAMARFWGPDSSWQELRALADDF